MADETTDVFQRHDSESEDGRSVATDDTGMFDTSFEPPTDFAKTATTSSRFPGPLLHNPDEIRLLVLHPWSYPLRASFEITTLQAPTPYIALSYAWGPTHADGSHLDTAIDLDGHSIRLTSHLKRAFERIRQHSRGNVRRVWCDAICINQANVDERNSQVATMGRIYAEAQCLFIWLGDEWDDAWFFDHEEQSVVRARGQDHNVSSLDGGGSNIPTEVAVELIRQSPYFTRRWTIQEVRSQSLRYVLAGARFIRFECLEQALQNCGKPMPSCFTDPCGTILDNLILYSNTECIDPRDRIFALLALCANVDSITPNYAADYTDVYAQFAATCLHRGLLFKVLVCAVETRRDFPPSRLPSWVPDWQMAVSQNILRLSTLEPHTFDIGTVECGRMHIRARLYCLCSGVVEDCQYVEAVQFIRDWRLARGLSICNNAEDYQNNVHACGECAGSTLCFVEDDGWGLLLTSASSPSVAGTEECEGFLLVDWFCVPMQVFVASEFAPNLGDLWYDDLVRLKRRAWFKASAISELTSIVLV
ncbi:hypothetical protein LTR97_012177 [Elasticomyces elasticus]|uniref:Heterokaryon incompatibility domain-containing protein n=1 Tax=Elasticomyces elasticus TaxID=574655 RepID=A0AAN7ZKS4_9PEZI|nr:hypothetical protein LTR97_012177 [Elasticomyces elasticus]